MHTNPHSKKENSQEDLFIANLSSGEKVYDRLDGHIHETIKQDLHAALHKINTQGRNEIIENVTLEGKKWKSFKVEVDPEIDDLFLARRENRAGLSTFVKGRQVGETNQMVIILSKNDPQRGSPEGYTLLTAFSGDLAPREPWDVYFNSGKTEEEKMKRRKEKEESLKYWTHHAFVPDENEFPVNQLTEQKFSVEALKFPYLTPEEKEKQVVYTGLFVTDESKLLSMFPPRHAKVFAHHSTIEFTPQNSNDIEIGKLQQLKIIGRVSDEKGDVLLVENPKSKSKYPHITLSCAEGTSPVYSNELLEKAIKEGAVEYFQTPAYIDVVEGFENGNKKVITKDSRLV